MVGSRWWHYPLIALVWASVSLPNLGGPSLWDIDEGNNAEAAREMLLSGDWVVPYFNYQLRYDKPPLLYWCQIPAYQIFGVGEFAARLPSALAVLATALVAYELGVAMFSVAAGLLAGLALPTCLLVCAAGHFANPDALLLLTLTLAFAFFWAWYRGSSWAALGLGVSIGLGVLAKGPVAVVLSCAIGTVFLLWQGELRRILSWPFLLGISAWGFVAIPWYAWVTVETRGAWLNGFWFLHNQQRFLTTLESHGGPFWYYLPVLLLGLAPWSLFLGPVLADAWGRCRAPANDAAESDNKVRRRAATRYLLTCAVVYVAFFSAAATKLPNYVLPIYPALVLLTADRLVRWQRRAEMPAALGALAAGLLVTTGLVMFVALVLLGGKLVPILPPAFRFPGVEAYAWLALLPLVTAGLLWYCDLRTARGFATAFILPAFVGTSVLAAWGAGAVEAHKAVRALAAELPADHLDRQVRVATCAYFQPSLVFYTQRQVEKLESLRQVHDALRAPQPTYLLMPETVWQELRRRHPGEGREVARRRDLYQRVDVVLVTNEPPRSVARR